MHTVKEHRYGSATLSFLTHARVYAASISAYIRLPLLLDLETGSGTPRGRYCRKAA